MKKAIVNKSHIICVLTTLLLCLVNNNLQAQDISGETIDVVCNDVVRIGFSQESLSTATDRTLNVICLPNVPDPDNPNGPFLSNKLRFFMVYIESGGTFTFTVQPMSRRMDYDFGVWLNPDLTNLGHADRGSKNYPYIGGSDPLTDDFIGLDTSSPEVCEESGLIGEFPPGRVMHLDVVSGDSVLIAIDRSNPEELEHGFSLSFGGDAVLACDMVETFNSCDMDRDGDEVFDLEAIRLDLALDYPNAIIDFYQDYNNAEQGNNIGVVNGLYTVPTNGMPPVDANYPDWAGFRTLYARIEDQNGTLILVKRLNFNVNRLPFVPPPQNPLEYCDFNGTGIGVFNLTTDIEDPIEHLYFVYPYGDDAAILGQQRMDVVPNITYYSTQLFAEEGNPANAIANPQAYTSTSGAAYVRVENIAGCYDVIEIQLNVLNYDLQLPSTLNVGECDTNDDGVVSFDLTSYVLSLGEEEDFDGYSIDYYTNEYYANQNENEYAIDNPENFTLYYGQDDIIYVRIFKGLRNLCYTILEIHLATFPDLILNEVEPQYVCDEDFDGIYISDLTDLEEEFTDTPEDFTFAYFDSIENVDNNSNINSPETYAFNSLPAIIWVSVTNENGCDKVVEVNYDVSSDLPYTAPAPVFLCQDTSGNSVVNLTAYQTDMTSLTSVIFSWFETYEEASTQSNPIATPSNYQVLSNEGTVYVRLRKRDYCPVIIPVTYSVLSSQDITVSSCDEDLDGWVSFDLPNYLGDLGIDGPENFNIYYFENVIDAQNGNYTSAVTNPNSYTLEMGNSNTVYIRIETETCFMLSELTLHALVSPLISVPTPAQVCYDEAVELIVTSNSDTVQWFLSEDATDIIFSGNEFTTPQLTENTTYWVETISDQGCVSERISVTVEVLEPIAPEFDVQQTICMGETINDLPTTSLNGITGSWLPEMNTLETTTYTFTPDEGQCALALEMTIEVYPIPSITVDASFQICEGTSADLNAETQEGNIINWYATEISATPIFTGSNFTTDVLTSDTSYWVESISEEGCLSERLEILVVVVESITPLFEIEVSYCLGDIPEILPTISANDISGSWSPSVIDTSMSGTFVYTFTSDDSSSCAEPYELSIEIISIPEVILIQETDIICDGDIFSEIIGTDLGNGYDYLWSTGATSPMIQVTEPGTYYVTISLGDTCSYVSNVLTYNQGAFDFSNPEIMQSPVFGSSSTIEVVSDGGYLEGYYYQLDQGPPQLSNIFNAVSVGSHTITIFNACGSVDITFYVIGFMPYFTPNGDGYHDQWQIFGLENQSQAKVYIFNRYGKQLAQIGTLGYGWDGLYNGNLLPSSDYWFRIVYNDPTTQELKEYRGHFSLKR